MTSINKCCKCGGDTISSELKTCNACYDNNNTILIKRIIGASILIFSGLMYYGFQVQETYKLQQLNDQVKIQNNEQNRLAKLRTDAYIAWTNCTEMYMPTVGSHCDSELKILVKHKQAEIDYMNEIYND